MRTSSDRPPKILVVEDFEEFRQFVVSTLQEKIECVVIESSDGLEALQKAEGQKPDLVLLDIGLPSLDGIQVARRLRKLNCPPKIIFVSQERSADVVQEAFNSGGMGYVTKSGAGRELLLAVETVLAGEQFYCSGLNQATRPQSTQLEELFRDITTRLAHEDGTEGLYDKIAESAKALARSQFSSLQMFYPKRGVTGELQLLAFRGFNQKVAKFWEWVRPGSGSSCAIALRDGKRVVVPDTRMCDFMAGTDDLTAYLEMGIHAVQSTPLLSRNGSLVGMLSTHWSYPHTPTENDLQRLDVLARHAADLIERKQSQQKS